MPVSLNKLMYQICILRIFYHIMPILSIIQRKFVFSSSVFPLYASGGKNWYEPAFTEIHTNWFDFSLIFSCQALPEHGAEWAYP